MENKAEIVTAAQTHFLSQTQREKLRFNVNPLGCDFIKTDKPPTFKQFRYSARSQYLLTDEALYYFDKMGQRLSKLKLDKTQLEEFNSFVNELNTTANRLNHLTQEHLDKITAITGNKHPSKRSNCILLSKKIPFLSTLIQTANDDGSSLGGLAELEDHVTESANTIAASSQLVDFALSCIDFILISATFITSILSGEKPPLTITQKGRWVYGAISIGLTATAIAVPALVSPLGMALAGLVFVSGVAGLIKITFNRMMLTRKLKKIEEKIANDMAELKKINEQTEQLEKELELAKQANNQLEIKQLHAQLVQLNHEFETRYAQKKVVLQTAHDEKLILEQQLAKLSKGAFFNKGLSIGLSGLALAGTVLSFIFPPVGFALIAATATIGLLAVLVKIIVNRVKSRAKKREQEAKKTTNTTQFVDTTNKTDVNPTLSNAKTDTQREIPTLSEVRALQELGITKTKAQAEIPKLESKLRENIELAKIIKSRNCEAILHFVERHALHISSTMSQAQEPEIIAYFNDFPCFTKQALPLLELAIKKVIDGEIILSESHIDNILACDQLKSYMHIHNIKLDQLAPTKTISPSEPEKEEFFSPFKTKEED